jgi:hypothetical protein
MFSDSIVFFYQNRVMTTRMAYAGRWTHLHSEVERREVQSDALRPQHDEKLLRT